MLSIYTSRGCCSGMNLVVCIRHALCQTREHVQLVRDQPEGVEYVLSESRITWVLAGEVSGSCGTK